MPGSDVQLFKERELRTLPDQTGVYALCDLDDVPLYVGQSVDSIRARVRRHLTSARSDVIANRQLDVWEIAFVWAWPMHGRTKIAAMEAIVFHHLIKKFELVNGDPPERPRGRLPVLPEHDTVQVIPTELIEQRRDPFLRFPRQISHFNQLVDYIVNTQDKPHLRQALQVYHRRLSKYLKAFIAG